MTIYSDDFNRTASTLGVTSVGGKTWRMVQGAFTTNGSGATTSSTNPVPIAVIDTFSPECAMSIDAYSGVALYARVKDASNWIRARVNYYSQTVSGGYNAQRSGSTTQTRYKFDGSISGGSAPSNAYNVNVGPWYEVNSAVEQRTITWNYDEYVSTTDTYYYYQALLDRCVDGTVTALATGTPYSSRQSRLTLRVEGAAVTMTHGATSTASVVADTATRAHGFGYGPSTAGFDNTFDNWTLDTIKAGVSWHVVQADGTLANLTVAGVWTGDALSALEADGILGF